MVCLFGWVWLASALLGIGIGILFSFSFWVCFFKENGVLGSLLTEIGVSGGLWGTIYRAVFAFFMKKQTRSDWKFTYVAACHLLQSMCFFNRIVFRVIKTPWGPPWEAEGAQGGPFHHFYVDFC